MDRTLGRWDTLFFFVLRTPYFLQFSPTIRQKRQGEQEPKVRGLSFIVINPHIKTYTYCLHSHTLFLCLLKLAAHGILADMMYYFPLLYFTLLRSVHGYPPKTSSFYLSCVQMAFFPWSMFACILTCTCIHPLHFFLSLMFFRR